MGVFAKCQIVAGQELSMEDPLITQNIRSVTEKSIARAISCLPSFLLNQFSQLCNSFSNDDDSPYLMGIFRSNALTIDKAGEEGVFLRASRFNHSCTPNANHCTQLY